MASIYDFPSIKYQAEDKLLSLAVTISEASSLKKVKSQIELVIQIRYYLKALTASESQYLSELQKSQIYYKLQEICEITSFPAAPSIIPTPLPDILIGKQGIQGPQGLSGSADLVLTGTFSGVSTFELDSITHVGFPRVACKWEYSLVNLSSSDTIIAGVIYGAHSPSAPFTTFFNEFTEHDNVTNAYLTVVSTIDEKGMRLMFNQTGTLGSWTYKILVYELTSGVRI